MLPCKVDNAVTHSELRKIQSHRIEVHNWENSSWAGYFLILGAPRNEGRRWVHRTGYKGDLFGSEMDQNIIGHQRGPENHLEIQRNNDLILEFLETIQSKHRIFHHATNQLMWHDSEHTRIHRTRIQKKPLTCEFIYDWWNKNITSFILELM